MPVRSCRDVFSRENDAALSLPAFTRRSRAGPGRQASSTAIATVSGSLSSTSTPASPSVSGTAAAG